MLDVHVYVTLGSTGETLKVVFPPVPQKLVIEDEAVIGIVFTVTAVRAPSHDPLLSPT